MPSSMSFAQSYVLASKVRSKLTKDASNANVPLRNLVVQANMLDNLMDHISNENNKRLEKLNQVKFEIPTRQSSNEYTHRTEVTEYEVSSDSDEDSDEYESDSDDYYYSSEEDEEDMIEIIDAQVPVKSQEPQLKLTTIEEIPELTKSESEESEEDSEEEHKNLGLEYYNPSDNLINSSLFSNKLHHHRNDAIYSINEVF